MANFFDTIPTEKSKDQNFFDSIPASPPAEEKHSFPRRALNAAINVSDLINPVVGITDPTAQGEKQLAFMNGAAKMVPGAEKAGAGAIGIGKSLINTGGLEGVSDYYNEARDKYKQADSALTAKHPNENAAGNVAGVVASAPMYGEAGLGSLAKMGFSQAASDSNKSLASEPLGFAEDVGLNGTINTLTGIFFGKAGQKLMGLGAPTKVAKLLRDTYGHLLPGLDNAIDKTTYEGADNLPIAALDKSGNLATLAKVLAANPKIKNEMADAAKYAEANLENFNQKKIQPLYNSVNDTSMPEKTLNPGMLGMDAPRTSVDPYSVTRPGKPPVSAQTSEVTIPDPRGGKPITRTVQISEGEAAIPTKTTNFSGSPAQSNSKLDDLLRKNPAIASAVSTVKNNMGEKTPADTMSLLKYARDELVDNPAGRESITNFMRENGAPQIDTADSLHKYYLGTKGNGKSPGANLRLIQGGLKSGDANIAKTLVKDISEKNGITALPGNLLSTVKAYAPTTSNIPEMLKVKGMDTKSLNILSDILMNPNAQESMAQIRKNPVIRQQIAKFLPYLGVAGSQSLMHGVSQ